MRKRINSIMQNNTYRLLTEKFNISEEVLDLISRSEDMVSGLFDELDDIMAYNQYKVLDAFQKTESETCTSHGTPVTDTMIPEEMR